MNQLYAFERKNNNFDFIRVLAAIGVVLSHSFDLSNHAALEPLRLSGANSVSFYSVRIFFIISGYLITGSAINTTSAISFFYKRILRIFPALIAVVVLSVFILGPWVTSLSAKAYFAQKQTYAYFSNIFLYSSEPYLPGVFQNNHEKIVNGSLWTLVFEFTFYIGVFVLSKLNLLSFRHFLLVSLCIVIWLETYYQNDAVLKAYFPSVNMSVAPLIEFFIFFSLGVLYYLFRDKITFNRVFAIATALFFVISATMFPPAFNRITTYLLLPYLVFFLSFQKSGLNHIGKYGDYSYGIYIYAFPIQQLLLNFFPDIFPWKLFLASFAITMVPAYLSWHFIESPAIRLKRAINFHKPDHVTQKALIE